MKRRKPDRPDPERVHEEMLRHLRDHPPPDPETSRPRPSRSRTKPREANRASERATAPGRPALMLRRLRWEVARGRLLHFLRVHQQRGTPEVLVVVGKGRNSPGGQAVLGPAVRELCGQRPDLVRQIREAPLAEGGHGALVVTLVPRG